MSFKPEVSKVLIFNRALAQLPADPVQDEDEITIEARECRRFYKPVVAELLERHHWNLATTRGTLAAIANDRENEWSYAYAAPTDLAYPVSIQSPSGSLYMGWSMQDFRYLMPGGRALFMQAKGTIYSMIETAQMEWTSFDITEAEFTARFTQIVELWLAARICMGVTKDQRRAAALLSQAEFETQRTIASDLNRNQPSYGDKPTESEIVRGAGFDRTFAGTGYPLDPVANPANTGT